MGIRRRRWAVVVFVLGALSAGWFSGAWACLNLATLNLSANRGPAGARITATGAGYSTVAPVAPVVLRWNGTDGPELARVVPTRAGELRATFTIPEGVPGYYVIVGVQRDAAGVDRYGTPSRASYQITGPAAPAPPPATTVAPPTTVRRPAPTSSTTSAAPTTTPPTTPATTPAVAVPAAATAEARDGLPAPAVAVAVGLVIALGAALRIQAGRL